MEPKLTAMLRDLERLLDQRKGIKTQELAKLTAQNEDLEVRKAKLKQAQYAQWNRAEMGSAPHSLWAEWCWNRQAELTDAQWHIAAQIEQQKVKLRRAIAQHHAIEMAFEKELFRQNQKATRRLNYYAS